MGWGQSGPGSTRGACRLRTNGLIDLDCPPTHPGTMQHNNMASMPSLSSFVVLIVIITIELIAESDVVIGFCHCPPIDDAFLPFFSFSFVIILLVVLLPSSSSLLCLPRPFDCCVLLLRSALVSSGRASPPSWSDP